MMLTIAKAPMSTGPFGRLVAEATMRRLDDAATKLSERLVGRTLWHVNSTAEGGGVAEMLHSLVGYYRGLDLDARWMVIAADADFFEVTKRIHNRLHGDRGDGGPLGPQERSIYDAGLRANLAPLLQAVGPGDVVILHDPQTLGMAGPLSAVGAHVVWVCHVGMDEPDHLARSAWAFFQEDVGSIGAVVFSRLAYVWRTIDPAIVHVIPPCIDPFSPKNKELDPPSVQAIVSASGLTPSNLAQPTHVRIRHRAEMIEESSVPPEVPLVVQVSRWDRLKDPQGVMRGFAEAGKDTGAHLILAGPAQDGVADDPEGGKVLADVRGGWRDLPVAQRRRVHIALLPMLDLAENSLVVNALQRRADVIVQKSLAEGFGLTVTEAMWKERTVVGSRVGGIQDQIEDGVSGILVDPTDLAAFGVALSRTLQTTSRRAIGRHARERVRSRYLPPHYLIAYLEMVGVVVGPS